MHAEAFAKAWTPWRLGRPKMDVSDDSWYSTSTWQAPNPRLDMSCSLKNLYPKWWPNVQCCNPFHFEQHQAESSVQNTRSDVSNKAIHLNRFESFSATKIALFLDTKLIHAGPAFAVFGEVYNRKSHFESRKSIRNHPHGKLSWISLKWLAAMRNYRFIQKGRPFFFGCDLVNGPFSCRENMLQSQVARWWKTCCKAKSLMQGNVLKSWNQCSFNWTGREILVLRSGQPFRALEVFDNPSIASELVDMFS